MNCLASRRNDWSFRLQQELKQSFSAYFVTLTYDNENVPMFTNNIERAKDVYNSARSYGVDVIEKETLFKRDVQLFLKRLRKDCVKWHYDITRTMKVSKNGSKLSEMRYYITGEYGEVTKRPHYHMILFNLPKVFENNLQNYWKLGFVHIGKVTDASIHYATKYVINRQGEYEGRVQPFALISKSLGKDYLDLNYQWHKKELRNYVINNNGKKQRLPRYYSDKIFNIVEKEHLKEEAIWNKDEKIEKEMDNASKVGDNYHQIDVINFEAKKRKFKQLNKKDKL